MLDYCSSSIEPCKEKLVPEEISEWGTVEVPSTKFVPEPIAVGDFRALVKDVQDDQWQGTRDFEGATARRGELFSRLGCPKSIKGGKPS